MKERKHDWPKVARQASKAYPNWYHVGDDVPRTTVDALRRGKMRDSDGLEIQTRNTHHEHGKRLCSLYVRKAST